MPKRKTPKPKSSPKELIVTTLVSPKPKLYERIIQEYQERNWKIIEVNRANPQPILLVVEHGQEIRILAGQTSQQELYEQGDSAVETPDPGSPTSVTSVNG